MLIRCGHRLTHSLIHSLIHSRIHSPVRSTHSHAPPSTRHLLSPPRAQVLSSPLCQSWRLPATLLITVTLALIPPKLKTNKKELSGAGVTRYPQNQAMGTKPQAWASGPGAPLRELPPRWPDSSKSQPCPAGGPWHRPPHTHISGPVSARSPGPSLQGSSAEPGAHLTRERLELHGEQNDGMLIIVRGASRRFHSFLLPHGPWKKRSCWGRRVCKEHFLITSSMPGTLLGTFYILTARRRGHDPLQSSPREVRLGEERGLAQGHPARRSGPGNQTSTETGAPGLEEA